MRFSLHFFRCFAPRFFYFFFWLPLCLVHASKEKNPDVAAYKAFEYALKEEDYAQCREMIKNGYNINKIPEDHFSHLVAPIRNGNFKGVQFLCQAGLSLKALFTIPPEEKPEAFFLKS